MVFAFGATIPGSGLDLQSEARRRSITPRSTIESLRQHGAPTTVIEALTKIEQHPNFAYLSLLRRVLFHRGLPGRLIILTGTGVRGRYHRFGDLDGPDITEGWGSAMLTWAAEAIGTVLTALDGWVSHQER